MKALLAVVCCLLVLPGTPLPRIASPADAAPSAVIRVQGIEEWWCSIMPRTCKW